MNKIVSVLPACLFLLTSLAYCAQKTIICEPPQGTRVDYFSFNNINLQNNTFLMGRDRVSGMRPEIVLHENTKEVFFTIGDAAEMKTQPTAANMNVMVYDADQISFAGLFKGAPILATYYPKTDILIYSQQSIWPGPNYQGARAVIFYSRCAKPQ